MGQRAMLALWLLLSPGAFARGAFSPEPSPLTQAPLSGKPPEQSVTSLAAALENPNQVVRQKAVFDLFNLGEKALPARAALVRALKDQDAMIRHITAMCLVRLGEVDAATLRAFVEGVGNYTDTMAKTALERSPALVAQLERSGCFGTCPSYALYVLKDGTLLYWGREFVKVEGVRTRRLTADELSALVSAFDEARFSALEDHYHAMHTDAPSVEVAFARGGQVKRVKHDLSNPGPEALRRLEKRFEQIVGVEQWVGAQEERDERERRKRDDATKAQLDRAPGLIAALQDAKPQVRRRAAAELYSMSSLVADPKRREWREAASRVLAEALGDASETVRLQAATTLRAAAAPAPEAVDALVQCLNDPSERVRIEAAWAIYQAGPAARSAVPHLVNWLTRPVFQERHLAAAVLGQIGPAAGSAVPALARALGDPDARVRDAAASALSSIGPAASAATGDLARTLRNDTNAGVRRLAAWALGHIGPAAASSIPALKAALADPSPAVREEAASALKAIERR